MKTIFFASFAALTVLSGTALLAMAPSLARASSIDGLGGQVFATGGEVFVDILPSANGSLVNHIRVYQHYPDTSSFVFLGTDRDQGTLLLSALGLSFIQGSEIVIVIEGYDGGSQDGPFYTGPSSRNYDAIAHGIVEPGQVFGDGVVVSSKIYFEDKTGGYDNSYNDVIIQIRQTQTPIPEPTTAVLVGLGLIGLGVRRKVK